MFWNISLELLLPCVNFVPRHSLLNNRLNFHEFSRGVLGRYRDTTDQGGIVRDEIHCKKTLTRRSRSRSQDGAVRTIHEEPDSTQQNVESLRTHCFCPSLCCTAHACGLVPCCHSVSLLPLGFQPPTLGSDRMRPAHVPSLWTPHA